MTIFHGSRYRLNDPVQAVDSDGLSETHYPLRETTLESDIGFRRYRTVAGDTMESLAFDKYGDANKWYVIADANPQIFWPLSLEAGEEIILPSQTYAELN